MIKFSKLLFLNPAKIWISGIKCNVNNIAKIVSVFNCNWVVVTIDSVTEESPFLALLKNQRLKYSIKHRSSSCLEISAVIPHILFKDFLEKAISEDLENVCVSNLLDPKNEEILLAHSFESLVAIGVTDVFISFSLSENALLICMNKSLLPSRAIFKEIKALDFGV